ncbi:MAG: dinitrogenase iron-molybdenum cofactor biosynthesis protein [Deltaproteobacteria bacterium]|nr:dinitrogenase iron-molybdenum cofactor biosynthesis protein [Deltaproteobacteria bacterium]MBW2338896.1 dinitrogenase iron-molybdenum cofactor biosynthesis protein [Deltaproteobacteria bacterium]
MKIAIPTWNGRVSPVFDAASRLVVVEVGEEGEYSRFETDISEYFPPSKTMRLTGLGVDTLICGAISKPLANMVTTAGINLIAWISGQVEDVLHAFLQGNLFDVQFMMPGRPGQWGKGPPGPGTGRGRRRRGIHFP